MEDRIRLTIADGIADVRLNRADKMNALDTHSKTTQASVATDRDAACCWSAYCEAKTANVVQMRKRNSSRA